MCVYRISFSIHPVMDTCFMSYFHILALSFFSTKSYNMPVTGLGTEGSGGIDPTREFYNLLVNTGK